MDKINITTPELNRLAMNMNIPHIHGDLPTFTQNGIADDKMASFDLLATVAASELNQTKIFDQFDVPIKMESDQEMEIEEKPCLPSLSCPSTSVAKSTAPINMKDQENLKLERKRERNRRAASKCRQRKLERINMLEEDEKLLDDQRVQLQECLAMVQSAIDQMSSVVQHHAKLGCHVAEAIKLSTSC